ncbi:MAG: hypothetical protein A2249_01420 [Candidatus Jacksonbacteria bacterium RIFOXYA2_FULL_44_7]|uniref:Uncharacterized protein n=1 Tax=Candidatus Jacksonbacteria bacterium RIFCSPLOWO2_02_FULL_44_20 TaxID=1798460 RepID=A0A1G2A8Y7_9BACT|nr:MAG: hypothetical protein UW39_C0003G0019 [Parcubacteria group bacterium GW2011_GWC2_44_17]KKT49558.1 MAG: hypothetical protein UW40_C0019G0006 [Parcubacteria group bacterium GW2011_GWF2_44_17]OGY71309.1 MAG: hypothetical protein A3C00_03265 [Candidatus Jacksonbacteria bacterium RIFCSPHIGHO2_02_FULL_44_25]OGY72124.1 MAG: hypothetical protein A3E05_01420 [Candidatus Jacksonbacteria bacterium RIFCSPHIGHO2_12_FULL_44_12]OGY72520.1 MAG: hypothetical protein A3H61_02975 [Candidatus Jacksonbacteri
MRENNIYPILLISASAASILLWVGVVIFIGPDELGVLGVALFLSAFGFAIFSSLLACFYYIHIHANRASSPPFRIFHRMFRESGLLTGVVIIYLILAHFGIGTFTNLGLLLGIAIVIDAIYIFYYDRRRRAKISEY